MIGVAEGKGSNIVRKLEMTKQHITHIIQGDTNLHCTERITQPDEARRQDRRVWVYLLYYNKISQRDLTPSICGIALRSFSCIFIFDLPIGSKWSI